MKQVALESWIASSVLLSLRIMPVFLLAPPFTLMRVPRLFAVLMSLGFSAALISAMPQALWITDLDAGALIIGALREFFLGLVPAVALQLLFAGLYIAGRTIDIQAGFGLAMLIDPTTRGQVPLAGTIFAYILGITFFAVGGHLDLLRYFAASLHAVPPGAAHGFATAERVAAYAAAVSLVALGIGGAVIVVLLLTDVVIAMLSRTVPQMNALLLGIQVKIVIMLVVLPIALGFSGAQFVRLVAMAFEAMPRLP